MKILYIILSIGLLSCIEKKQIQFSEDAKEQIKAELRARCLVDKEYSDADYSVLDDDIHCKEKLALCTAPCNRIFVECEDNNYFTRDKNACKEKEFSPCLKKCNKKFPCHENTNKRLKDCNEKNKKGLERLNI